VSFLTFQVRRFGLTSNGEALSLGGETMPQANAPDKRAQVLICHGPSCCTRHGERIHGELLEEPAVIGGCLGMCPVGPNAIVRRGEIGPTNEDRRIAEGDTILCGITDEEELQQMVRSAATAPTAPRLLRGRSAPTFRR